MIFITKKQRLETEGGELSSRGTRQVLCMSITKCGAMTHTQCHFNNFLCLISFSLTSSLTEQHSDCGLRTTSGLWGSPRWSGKLNVLGTTLYPTDLMEKNRVLQKVISFLLCEWTPEGKTS